MIRRDARPVLVVIGTGMAAAKLVSEILARDPQRYTIRMFGEEPGGTYNRVLLSHVLGGRLDPQRFWMQPLEWYTERGVTVHAGVRADRIDRQQQVVYAAGGKVAEPYDELILATGSRPYVPPCPGVTRKGVFVFRTFADCAAIADHAQHARRAVVVGGGLLGLEAAYGLLAHQLEVTVLEKGPHVMMRQLDETGGKLLQRQLEALGVRVLTNARVAALEGPGDSVAEVVLNEGTRLPAELVIISCGIQPNVELAVNCGLQVKRGIVVDDQLRTSDPNIYAVGECAEHRDQLYGLVEPAYEQANVLAEVLTQPQSIACYRGSCLATTLKVMGVEVAVMERPAGESPTAVPEAEMISHLDLRAGTYKKLVLRDGRIERAIVLGEPAFGQRLLRMFREQQPIEGAAQFLLQGNGAGTATDHHTEIGTWSESTEICRCHRVTKGSILAAIKAGARSVEAVGEKTKAGTGCGSCQALLQALIDQQAPVSSSSQLTRNKVELLKQEQGGLEALPRILELAATNAWQELSEADKQRAKWHGLFFRQTTPGYFMMRLRLQGGRLNARQLRVIADLSDEYGRGFCDLTTRQQIQLRWFTLADVPDIWRRLADVGLHSKQTGMDNIRGVCGCPLAGLTPDELFDASPVIAAFDELIVNNSEFTNLPRKFNVTITGCLQNCCHTETQDLALIPAIKEEGGETQHGFNILVGGKQGSGGYQPAVPLDVFVTPDQAALLAAEVARIFRDHGLRATRVRARLAFLIQERGIKWLRQELQRRWREPLKTAGRDARLSQHQDHLGLQPQRAVGEQSLFSAGLLVPVGRITTEQLRGVASLAERYGSGQVRLTTTQNVIIPNIPAEKVTAFEQEPLLQELSLNPSPIMRGLVTCTGNDYCHMALIDTKGYALQVARELEQRLAGRAIPPLSIHWSGCAAGCGLHQAATIGLQGCRSRVQGQIVDAAHVTIQGRTGPQPRVGSDLMYDVPIDRLPDALELLVRYLPRD